MYEPLGIWPGVGIVVGGGRLAVASHGAAGGEGCTTSAPLGRTVTVLDAAALLGEAVPHAPRVMAAATTTTLTRPRRPRRVACGGGRLIGTPQSGAGTR